MRPSMVRIFGSNGQFANLIRDGVVLCGKVVHACEVRPTEIDEGRETPDKSLQPEFSGECRSCHLLDEVAQFGSMAV